LPLAKYTVLDLSIARAGPELGEHSDEILERFGYSAAEIAEFRRRDIV